MPEGTGEFMKVRVKEDQKGFIYGSLRKSGDEFTLKAFKHPRKTDDKDEPLVISIKDQFSKVWMEEVKTAKPKKAQKTD